MNRALINPAIMQDIADAIREKGGQEEPIVADTMGDAIRALPQGMGDNTTEVVEAISGEQPEGDIAIANAIAKGATDAAREHVWQGSRATDEGRELRDGVAFVDAIKGQSVKVVQIRRDNFAYSSGDVVRVVNNDGIVSIEVASPIVSMVTCYSPRATVEIGHKYLLCGGLSSSIRFGFGGGTDRGKGAVYTENDSPYRYGYIYLSVGLAAGTYVLKPQIFDLTAMGMEDVVDADDFAHRLGYADAASLPYIPYGEQIVNSKPTEVVSRGRNLLKLADENKVLYTQAYDVYKYTDTGISCERPALCTWKIPCKPNTQYTAQIAPSVLNSFQFRIYQYFGEPSAIGVNDSNYISTLLNTAGIYVFTFTTAPNATWLQIGGYAPQALEISNFILEEGNILHAYTPYREPSRLPLPLSSILHEGQPLFLNGLCGIGDVKDEVDWAKGKAVKRIGVVDMGTISSWNRGGDNNTYYTTIIPLKPRTQNTLMEAYSKETPEWEFYNLKGDHKYGVANTAFYVTNGSALSIAQIRDALQGVLLFYELADPIEVTFDPCKAFYKVQNGGTEEAVMDGVSTPIVADIVYRYAIPYEEHEDYIEASKLI